MGQNLKASLHYHTDDTIIYCGARTTDVVFQQLAFDCMQSQLGQLNVILNAEKNKGHVGLKQEEGVSSTSLSIETVASSRYSGIVIDGKLSFKPHSD